MKLDLGALINVNQIYIGEPTMVQGMLQGVRTITKSLFPNDQNIAIRANDGYLVLGAFDATNPLEALETGKEVKLFAIQADMTERKKSQPFGFQRNKTGLYTLEDEIFVGKPYDMAEVHVHIPSGQPCTDGTIRAILGHEPGEGSIEKPRLQKLFEVYHGVRR